jgi:hypothetical protein
MLKITQTRIKKRLEKFFYEGEAVKSFNVVSVKPIVFFAYM